MPASIMLPLLMLLLLLLQPQLHPQLQLQAHPLSLLHLHLLLLLHLHLHLALHLHLRRLLSHRASAEVRSAPPYHQASLKGGRSFHGNQDGTDKGQCAGHRCHQPGAAGDHEPAGRADQRSRQSLPIGGAVHRHCGAGRHRRATQCLHDRDHRGRRGDGAVPGHRR
ncbi:hypothetical protein XAC3810_530171 [Xanthomonas citri pv. citri]|nr:hypothetical protein XAC9322_530171 [Xanthomonas citri pv. citri]CEE33881.1 hypothetical protein XAC1083_530147 [Xanthomonas citri pv. citri]CEE43261.1 hypothetical protein XAC3810_530171 [Xanthomonas citri pv. citri]CEE47065.1 hypothetical protein XAC908_770173 [Xanthomonas citri pv. citri]CEE52996.1 hypothetical protein XAC3608_1110130 [Xanthomonas citri pv. citri]